MQNGEAPISKSGSSARRWLFTLLLCAAAVAVSGFLLWPRFSESGDDEESPQPLSAVALAQLTASQQRGKQIYLTGVSPSGASMTALLGNSSTEVPAAVLKCVNCHRHDGRGKPEGGIYPSNIRWDELTKPYGSDLPRGRSRPPYDASQLKRSISMGLDSAGRPLDNAMPRYRMAHGDMADLVAYLKIIGRELDPGLTDESIRIGVILAPRERLPDMNLAVRSALTAYTSELNQNGGVYRRQIELCFFDSPPQLADRAEAAINFVNRENIFALTSVFLAGSERQLSQQLDEHGVPLVGATTLYPQLEFPLNRYLFYIGSGIDDQSRALLNFARGRQPAARFALLFVPDENLSRVADAVSFHCERLGLKLQKHELSADLQTDELTSHLKQQDVSCVLSLLPGEQSLDFLHLAAASEWFPECYVPGAFVGPELFEAPLPFNKRVFLSFPTMPARQSTVADEYNQLAKTYQLPGVQLAAQFEALAAAKTLVHGLQKSGVNLSRERLVEQLETIFEFRTEFSQPLSFGPNRRVGTSGAFVVTLDLTEKQLVSVSDWVDGSTISRY